MPSSVPKAEAHSVLIGSLIPQKTSLLVKKSTMESIESTGALIRGINEEHTFSQDEQHSSKGIRTARSGTLAFLGISLAPPSRKGSSPSDPFQCLVV